MLREYFYISGSVAFTLIVGAFVVDWVGTRMRRWKFNREQRKANATGKRKR